jgi:hypothetical protein
VRVPVGLVHFDTHTRAGLEVFGALLSHGTVMRRLVEAGKDGLDGDGRLMRTAAPHPA